MRVVFDVSPLSHPLTGVGNYIRGMLAGLVEAAGEDDEIVPFAPTSSWGVGYLRSALEGIDTPRSVRVLPFAHAVRTAWSKLGRPPVERFAGRLDAFHYSDWMYPTQRGGVRATTVHDLVPLRFPEWVQGRTRRMHRAKYRHMQQHCDIVFCNSRYTANDVQELLSIPAERLRVAHPAVGSPFGREGERADLGRPFLLSVATQEPRKNLSTLLRAVDLLDGELALALVGAEGWGASLPIVGERVIRLGYVSTEELARLYRGASAFVYPSLFEGYGMPVAEAMACGAPCVVSSHPSLNEVCGDAAVRVEPLEPESIADGIREALSRREELVEAGVAQTAGWSWRDVGAALLEGYREASG
ncbi:MAG: glycosyltransferase family 4 protein [Gaiellaceae bacterium]